MNSIEKQSISYKLAQIVYVPTEGDDAFSDYRIEFINSFIVRELIKKRDKISVEEYAQMVIRSIPNPRIKAYGIYEKHIANILTFGARKINWLQGSSSQKRKNRIQAF